jgi:hypothetical protein
MSGKDTGVEQILRAYERGGMAEADAEYQRICEEKRLAKWEAEAIVLADYSYAAIKHLERKKEQP